MSRGAWLSLAVALVEILWSEGLLRKFFAGRLAFISAHYRLPQCAVVDLESGKPPYKITASIDNRELGIPVDCDGETAPTVFLFVTVCLF